MIWRDDDILWQDYPLEQLLAVDDLFQAEGIEHTVAVLASTLTPALAQAILARRMTVQLHGWRHDDLSTDRGAGAELPAAVAKIEQVLGVRPTVLYPPWNKTSPYLEAAARDLGLVVSAEKVSLDFYIRKGGKVSRPVINFHYWAPECALLPAAFALDPTPRRARCA